VPDPTRPRVPPHLQHLQERAAEQRRVIEHRCLQIITVTHHRRRLIDEVLDAAASLDASYPDWTALLEHWGLTDLAAAHDALADVYEYLATRLDS